MIDDNIPKVPENDETADFDEIDLPDGVSVEDLQTFMKVDPKKVKKAEEKAARRKAQKRKKGV